MDKKNTLLLTVIAIATLLVAVVGATFAYFSAQTGNAVGANVNVTTSSVDTATMKDFSELTLQATQQNFGQGMGSLYAETSGSVSFTANSDKDSEYCYVVDLTIGSNNFEYSLADSKPELIFSISKGSASGSEAEYTVDTLGKAGLNLLDKSGTTATRNADVLSGTTKQCKYVAPATQQSTECDPQDKVISGYDITTKPASTIFIPNSITGGEAVDGYTGGVEDGAKYIHKIKATAGKTTTDYWKAKITFANYNEDQQKNAQLSSSDTTHGKTFTATVNFTPVDCKTGASLKKA